MLTTTAMIMNDVKIVVYEATKRKHKNNMFSDNTVIRYVYSMTGEKLRVTRTMGFAHAEPIPTPTPINGGQLEPIEATQISEALILDDTEYLDADFTGKTWILRKDKLITK